MSYPRPVPTLLDLPYELSSEAIARYRNAGFIKLKEVFDVPTIDRYRQAIVEKVEEFAGRTPPLNERTTYGKAFLQLMNLWRASTVVEELVRSRRLARLAADLMECDRVRLYHDQALCKEAGGGLTPWHVDQHYWPLATDRTITAWIPLQAVPIEMGPLAFAEGSQRILSGRHLAISDESEREISLTFKDSRIDEAPFDLGEVSFHSGWTFHRAGANTTDRIRHVMTVIYHDGDATVAEPRSSFQLNDLANWLPGCVPGGVAASPLNPVLWDRSWA
jgi:ectoine hydroxylase-related dioxygenase (phytanoyl-CoA dioxygenase family)